MAEKVRVLQDTPLALTIPIPHHRETQFGVNSTGFEGASRIVFRLNEADRKLIKKWANILNVSESSFVRECAVNAARQLEEHERKHNEDQQPNRN